MDEPTAWEDINPAMALAPRPEQPPAFSERLQPAKPELFRNELGACLALVAPVGMDEEARVEWLAVAWQTLSHLPPDILVHGCQKARETVDHPSKIVPAIIAETEEAYALRRRIARDYAQPALPAPRELRNVMDRRGEPMSEEDTVELNRILEGLGATARYRPDGSRHLATNSAE